MSKWPGCPTIACKNDLCQYGCQRRVIEKDDEIKRLRLEVETWKARAFAMFWRLPDDTNLAELREQSEQARAFIARS